jgi:hypothetical protein
MGINIFFKFIVATAIIRPGHDTIKHLFHTALLQKQATTHAVAAVTQIFNTTDAISPSTLTF